MQIPLWLFLTSIILALTLQDMASLLLKRGASSSMMPTHLFRVATAQIKPLVPLALSRKIPQFLQPLTPPTSRHYSTTPPPIMSASEFLATVKNRRTNYALSKESTIPDSQIESIIRETILHVPSSFNSQSTRAVLLVKEEHDKLWEIVKSVLKAIVPAEQFASTEKRINGFKGAYGTVMFFEDRTVVNAMQEKYAIYADRFPGWSVQSSTFLPFLPVAQLEFYPRSQIFHRGIVLTWG